MSHGDESHDHSWDDFAETWDDQEGVVAYADSAFQSLAMVLDRHNRSLDGAAVMDFGCGTGLLTERLVNAGASVHAVDVSEPMLAVLTAKIASHRWVDVVTSQASPTEGPVFDVVVCSSVLSFVADYPVTVSQLVSALKPGGLFIQWDWEQVDGEAGGLSRTEISDALTGAGLEQVTVAVGFELAFGDEVMAPLMGHGLKR